jgi:hypothetical protein
MHIPYLKKNNTKGWQSGCVASSRPSVQTPLPLKKNKTLTYIVK